MKKNKVDKQHKKQISYFGEEFSKVKEYVLDPWQASYIKRIKKHVIGTNYKNKTLIDVGTGLGYVAIEMAKLGINVIACDLTKEALDNISRYKKKFKLSNIRLIECRAEKIPIKSDSVDFLVANAVLEHIPQEKEAIEEWKRILKPGARAMITVPIKYRFVVPCFLPIVYIYDKKIGHLRRYDIEELKEKFNLKLITSIYTGHFLRFVGILFFTFFKTHRFDQKLEEIDARGKNNRYGASNVIAVFEKARDTS